MQTLIPNQAITVQRYISPSNDKGLGEIAVRKVFPEATIVRPGAMFGWEDRFLRKLAASSVLFSTNHNKELVRPIHVRPFL